MDTHNTFPKSVTELSVYSLLQIVLEFRLYERKGWGVTGTIMDRLRVVRETLTTQ